jgi:hypothetical protein
MLWWIELIGVSWGLVIAIAMLWLSWLDGR